MSRYRCWFATLGVSLLVWCTMMAPEDNRAHVVACLVVAAGIWVLWLVDEIKS